MFVILAFAVAMVVFPGETEAGSKVAIMIWANSILPVMLPFFIFSDLLKKLGLLNHLPSSIYPMAVAFLSGYPMGAKVVGDLVSGGSLEEKKGRWVLSYSMITGPAFLIATVGQFLGSNKAGLLVAIAHYLGAISNGILWLEKLEPLQKLKQEGRRTATLNDFSVDQISQSILAGCRAMAIVLAYLMIAMIGMNLVEATGAFDLMGCETVQGTIKGLFEMTAGISMVGTAEPDMRLRVMLASFLVSFGGLSVLGQSYSMLGDAGISFKDVFLRKFTHGILAGIFSMILAGVVI